MILFQIMPERIHHRGVPIDNISHGSALVRTIALMGFPKGYAQQIVTLTPLMYVTARTDPAFLSILEQASLVVPESTGLNLYSYLVPPRLTRVVGSSLASDIVHVCPTLGFKVALLGASEENRRAASANLQTKHPNLKIITIDGQYYFKSDQDSRDLVDDLDFAGPDFTVMAGLQVDAERWINQWLVRDRVHAGVVGNFGRTIKIWAGQDKEYATLSKLGLVWLARLTTEDNRLRRRNLTIFTNLAKLLVKDLLPS